MRDISHVRRHCVRTYGIIKYLTLTEGMISTLLTTLTVQGMKYSILTFQSSYSRFAQYSRTPTSSASCNFLLV